MPLLYYSFGSIALESQNLSVMQIKFSTDCITLELSNHKKGW